MKERLGLTEVRKAANRMNFGEVKSDGEYAKSLKYMY